GGSMLEAGLTSGKMLETFRQRFGAERYHHVVAPAIFDSQLAATLRQRLSTEALSLFHFVDRGRYHQNVAYRDEPLLACLTEFAEQVVEARLQLGAAHWLRFGHGDYQLIRGDAIERPLAGRHLELTLDFSAVTTEQAEIVYTNGHDSFIVPQWCNSLALV